MWKTKTGHERRRHGTEQRIAGHGQKLRERLRRVYRSRVSDVWGIRDLMNSIYISLLESPCLLTIAPTDVTDVFDATI